MAARPSLRVRPSLRRNRSLPSKALRSRKSCGNESQSKGMNAKRKLSAGDWVKVRSKKEILKTLDAKGQLDGMAFMPEMFRYCGQTFQVYKRAHKTCDYSTPYPFRTRRLEDTVHLNTRCDGQAHGDCHAGCLLYWKIQWLETANSGGEQLVSLNPSLGSPASGGGCSESNVSANTRSADPD